MKNFISKNNKYYFDQLFFLAITYIFIDFSPSLIEKIQPDSHGYINGSSSRQYIYTATIEVLNLLKIDIIFFQKLLLTASIISLFYFLKKKIGVLQSIIFYLLIISNVYYTSFSKVILTESIFFSLINFALIILFNLDKKKTLILFGLVGGLIFSIKPIGMAIMTTLLILSIVKLKSFKKVLVIILFSLIPIMIENYLFFSKYEQRDSVFTNSVSGKLFLLSGKNSFEIENYPKEYHPMLQQTKKEFREIDKFLLSIDNILLRAELLSDYEVVAQYQTFEFDSIRNINFDKSLFVENANQIALEILRNNFFDYLKLSFLHYIGNWSIGSKARFLDENSSIVPRLEELKKSSGPMNLPNNMLLSIAQIYFIILFFALTIYSLLVLFFCSILEKKRNFEDFSYIFIIQSYLILISLTNVSTPRYLMLFYPLIVIVLIKFLDLLKKRVFY